MDSTNKKVLAKIAKASRVIKKKYKDLKMGVADAEKSVEDAYKPIVEPFKKLVHNSLQVKKEKIKNEEYDDEEEDMQNTFKVDKKKGKKEEEKNGEESLENVSDKSLAEKSNQSMLVDDPEVFSILIIVLEIYPLRNVLFNTDENDDIIIGENKYPGTRGLHELIFMKQPNEYTKDDEKNYKKILLKTNAYRRNRSSEDQIKGSRGSKYKNIISNLITKKSATKSTTSKTLSGLSENQSRTRVAKTLPNDDNDQNQLIPSKMLLNNHVKDYVYWDNPNELVDRLKLLIASKNAGHTNHDNEIISIIEEMREDGVIP
ncbi:uncharacterized protein [Prorops nasuta]|uniref:uncharacterized protein n=1 Tax=Prorops nasuta TaxID=863751 RepID=UPI0034CFCF2C